MLKIKVTRSKVLVPKERSPIMHLFLKYQSPKALGSKYIVCRLKFFKTRSKPKIKVTRSKVLVSMERSLYNASIS
jgi:hypothetical protein